MLYLFDPVFVGLLIHVWLYTHTHGIAGLAQYVASSALTASHYRGAGGNVVVIMKWLTDLVFVGLGSHP